MEIFNVKNSYLNSANLRKDLDEIGKIANKDLNEMSVEEINKIIFLYERSSISLRRYLEKTEKEDNQNYFIRINNKEKRSKNYLNNLPVTIEKKGNIYHIFTPYTFKKGLSESYGLANYLRGEVNKKIEEGMAFEIKGKQLVLALRVGDRFINTRYRDNDNMETTELINVIFSEAFVKSDNALNMCFMSDFILSDDDNLQGFHIFVMPYSEITFKPQEILDIFKKIRK